MYSGLFDWLQMVNTNSEYILVMWATHEGTVRFHAYITLRTILSYTSYSKYLGQRGAKNGACKQKILNN